ncbi:MAG: chorismate mutase [Rhodospirillales bacterium]|nr:MAG: chorismate mutase [Rhodospirillales bacterium]
MTAPLDELRQQIDGIDDAVHDLLMRRAELVGRIGAAKGGAGGLALRPGREAKVIRRLLGRHAGSFPAPALVRLWREIVSSFTFLQCPIRVAVYRPADQPGYWDLARDHFGVTIPFTAHESPAQVLAAVRADPNVVGVVPVPQADDPRPWWPGLASGDPAMPNVVQRLPFVPMPNARGGGLGGFVLARLEAEDSGEDRSLILVETHAEISRARVNSAAAKAGLGAPLSAWDFDQQGAHHDLLEVAGYVGDADPRLAALVEALGSPGARVLSLGAYAVSPVLR